MSRFEDSAHDDAAIESRIAYALFVDFDFASGHLRLTSMDHSYSFGGNTYIGLGTLTGIGEIHEAEGISSAGLEFVLSGASDSLVTTALGEKYHGRDVTLYMAYLDPDTNEPVATPEVLWEGFMDVMSVRLGKNTRQIAVACENRLILWNRSIGLLYADEHQKATVDSTDSFFDQSSALTSKIITWMGHRVGIGHSIAFAYGNFLRSAFKKLSFGFL